MTIVVSVLEPPTRSAMPESKLRSLYSGVITLPSGVVAVSTRLSASYVLVVVNVSEPSVGEADQSTSSA